MAKGNDGNYLQHSVEAIAALHLASRTPERRLHVALTHGMAPYEPCDAAPHGQARALLASALREAQQAPTGQEPTIVAAYRATGASSPSYPNTGELLAALIGRSRLSGAITEVIPKKHTQLLEAWFGFAVTPVLGSWRRETHPGGS